MYNLLVLLALIGPANAEPMFRCNPGEQICAAVINDPVLAQKFRKILDLQARLSSAPPPSGGVQFGQAPPGKDQAWQDVAYAQCRGEQNQNDCLNKELDKRIDELTLRVDMKKPIDLPDIMK
jgi:hypothetical protein